MSESIFPKMDLLPHPLRRVGSTVVDMFRMHQLASHGDHFVHDPLASPIEPVTDWPKNGNCLGLPKEVTALEVCKGCVTTCVRDMRVNQIVDEQALADYERVFDGGNNVA